MVVHLSFPMIHPRMFGSVIVVVVVIILFLALFSKLVANPQKMLFTEANPAPRGPTNMGKITTKRYGSASPPPARAVRSEKVKINVT